MWSHDDGIRLFEVSVDRAGVSTFREDGKMYQPRDACSLEEYAATLGRGAEIRAEVVRELPSEMVLEIDQLVRQLIAVG